MKNTAAVITVSDKGHRGERVDTSGPNLCALLESRGFLIVHTAIVPDEEEKIRAELLHCTDALDVALVLTTGGTGFSPRDITPEATLSVLERQTPGIAEAMRTESMKITPKACLSRAVAGIRSRTLIVNLPGSKKAAEENLLAVLEPLCHGLEMLQGEGSADCAAPEAAKCAPSVDAWLREAKAHESAPNVGIYLTAGGVVRETAKAKVRRGEKNTGAVTGMLFSYDREKVDAVVADTYALDGVFYIKVWLNEGKLARGDDILRALVGADIRPHAEQALQYMIGRIKSECVTEQELYE